MPPRKTTGTGGKKRSVWGLASHSPVKKNEPAGSADQPREFQSDLALDIIGELYPLLLENCTDEDDEIDAQAVFEVLAGLIGLFTADYHENYGQEKASAAFQDLVSLALATYQQRLADNEA